MITLVDHQQLTITFIDHLQLDNLSVYPNLKIRVDQCRWGGPSRQVGSALSSHATIMFSHADRLDHTLQLNVFTAAIDLRMACNNQQTSKPRVSSRWVGFVLWVPLMSVVCTAPPFLWRLTKWPEKLLCSVSHLKDFRHIVYANDVLQWSQTTYCIIKFPKNQCEMKK